MSFFRLHGIPLSNAVAGYPLRKIMTSATHYIRESYPATHSRIRFPIGRVGPGRPYLPSLRSFSGGRREELEKEVRRERVVVFMKGTKEAPRCGFSNTVVQILKALETPFHTVDILEDDSLRQDLKEFSAWPTFPQLYIDGDFFGGCDIAIEAYKNGQLKQLLEKKEASSSP